MQAMSDDEKQSVLQRALAYPGKLKNRFIDWVVAKLAEPRPSLSPPDPTDIEVMEQTK